MTPPRKAAKSSSVAKQETQVVSPEALRSTTSYLAELIEQKKPILEALETCAKQQTKSLAVALMGMRRAIRAGISMADAMARYPEVFPASLRDTVRTGENSGDVAAKLRLWTQDTASPGKTVTNQSEQLLTLDQAVQFLGTSKPTLYRLLAQGHLNGLKVGRQWRFRKADLVAHMERKPAAVAVTAEPEIDAEIEFFEAEAKKAGIPLREDKEEEIAASELKIIQIVSGIISLAINASASDIHIESTRKGCMVRFRIDGVLYVVREMPQSLFNPLIGRLKVMADLDVMERRLPQDGRIHIKYQEQNFDLRISTCPNMFGESIVLRILLQTNELPGLEAIGWSPDNRALVEKLLQQPCGLVIFTGPTGSGKTTTMYSCLQLRLKPEVKTMTIEDPVEYILPYATQAGVNVKAGLTFATALRSFLRQDPDIIMVGELRDLETAGIAVQAALTGHLVLTAMHSNDAVGALKRLVDVGVEPFLVSSSAIGVISQRLVRMVCESCRQHYSPPRELLEHLGYNARTYPRAKFVRGAGCSKCRFTGYRRRMAIQEVLMVNEKISGLILNGASHEELQQAAERNGMVSLQQDGLRKCVNGLTTPEEVMRVAFAGS